MLFPLRLYALATIRTSEWGTREVKDTIFKPSFWQAYVYHMALFGIGLHSIAKGSYDYTKATALHAVRPVTLLMTSRYRKTQDAFVNVYENESTRFAEWNKYIQRLDKSSTKSLCRQYRALQRFDNFFIVRQYLPILYNDEIGAIPHSSHKNDLAIQHASSIA